MLQHLLTDLLFDRRRWWSTQGNYQIKRRRHWREILFLSQYAPHKRQAWQKIFTLSLLMCFMPLGADPWHLSPREERRIPILSVECSQNHAGSCCCGCPCHAGPNGTVTHQQIPSDTLPCAAHDAFSLLLLGCRQSLSPQVTNGQTLSEPHRAAGMLAVPAAYKPQHASFQTRWYREPSTAQTEWTRCWSSHATALLPKVPDCSFSGTMHCCSIMVLLQHQQFSKVLLTILREFKYTEKIPMWMLYKCPLAINNDSLSDCGSGTAVMERTQPWHSRALTEPSPFPTHSLEEQNYQGISYIFTTGFSCLLWIKTLQCFFLNPNHSFIASVMHFYIFPSLRFLHTWTFIKKE